MPIINNGTSISPFGKLDWQQMKGGAYIEFGNPAFGSPILGRMVILILEKTLPREYVPQITSPRGEVISSSQSLPSFNEAENRVIRMMDTYSYGISSAHANLNAVLKRRT